MNVRRASRLSAGFTILELMLAIVLLSILMYKAHGAMSAVQTTADETSAEVLLEQQAQRLLKQVGYAIMGSNRQTLIPESEAPLSANDLKYRVNLGIQDGEVVWSDPEKVAMEERALQVYWSQNPEEEHERRVVWSNLVSPFLEGEIPNGMDDNGNGLIDEQGLSFVVEGDSVTIRLTLERLTRDGERVTKMVQTVVTCRNLGEEAE